MNGKRICAVLGAFALAVTTAFAAGSAEGGSATDAKARTFSYWVALNASGAEVMKDWGQTTSMQQLEKMTGVHIDFVHPSIGQEAQAFNLMIASGDLPDLIQEREGSLYYPGGADKAIQDGVYLDLTDLIDKHAPNYKKWLSKNETIAKMTMTDSGKRWGMFHLTDDAEPAWTGFVVRKDWLDELGLKPPVTLDDWYAVLKAFKEKKGVPAPLLVYNTGVPAYNHIISAFDIGGVYDKGRAFYQVKGKVQFGPIQSAYKEYLALMHKWYKEGLLDPDFMGRTDGAFEILAPTNLVATDRAGMFATIWGRTANAYVVRNDVKDNPNFYLLPIAAPKRKAGQQIHFNYPSYEVRAAVAITKKCKDPVAAIKWLDQMYTTEGANAINYGAEGDTFTLVDGKPVYTDKIIKPAGMTAAQALQRYCRWDGPGVMDYKRMWQLYRASGQGEMLKALDVWKQDDISYVLPPISLTQEEATENSNIMPDIITYVNEMTVKFIIGGEPLSGFDSFVAKIKGMKIDRAMQIQQAALDRYNKRK
jgi:putative aldouronate transport system substrate-binding protein